MLTDELETLKQKDGGCNVIYPETEYQRRIQANSSASDDIEAGSRDIDAPAPHDQGARSGFKKILTNFIADQVRSALGVNPANLRRPVTRNEARIDPDASGAASQPSRTPNNRGPHQSGNQGNDNNLR